MPNHYIFQENTANGKRLASTSCVRSMNRVIPMVWDSNSLEGNLLVDFFGELLDKSLNKILMTLENLRRGIHHLFGEN